MTDRPPLDLRGEIPRKALHLASLALPAGMVLLPFSTAMPILAGLSLTAIGVEIARDRSATVHAWLDRTLGWMMRPRERRSGGGFTGATWVVVTATLLLAAFPATTAAAGMAIGLVGDAAAAVVGRTIGRHRWPGVARTLEGTAAFVLAGIAVAALFPDQAWSARIVAVAVAAVAEMLPIPLNDNLVVPFAAAGALALMG